MVQGLRIRLPMQEMQVRNPVGELRSHTSRAKEACALQWRLSMAEITKKTKQKMNGFMNLLSNILL